MAYPPRPGMPPPPGMGAVPPPVYGMIRPPMMVPPGPATRGAPPHSYGPPSGGMPHHGPPPPLGVLKPVSGGPPVTVFVGNITERAQDAMIRHLLTTCGPVITWKRVQGATGKLQAFGFCEYANPDAGLRAIRLLHDREIVEKSLVVKVDAKTKAVLDDYRRQRIKETTGRSPQADGDEEKENELFMDAAMRHEDMGAIDRIKAILHDHSKDMMNYMQSDKRFRSDPKKHLPPGSIKEDGSIVYTGPKESLDDADIEDGKRDIIHREIDKFRETMRIREAEKEEEKNRREKEEESAPKRRKQDDSRASSKRRSSRSKSKEGSRSPRRRDDRSFSRRHRSRTDSRSRSRERERERDRVERERERERERDREQRMERERESRDRDRERERRERSRRSPSTGVAKRRKTMKETWKEQDMEDEERERKKAERKARDKETNYQERLLKWEARETRMAKDYEKERLREIKRLDEIEKEGKKLKEFLEDYDDDRDDEKYYKSDRLDRRLVDREREAQRDTDDRLKEKEEIAELKDQIMKEGFGDPNAELQRRIAFMERSTLPTKQENGVICDDVEVVEPEVVALSPRNVQEVNAEAHRPTMGEYDGDDGLEDNGMASPAHSNASSQSRKSGYQPTNVRSSSLVPVPPPLSVNDPSAEENRNEENMEALHTANQLGGKQNFQLSGRRKIDVRDVFNQDDDDELPNKRRKGAPPLHQVSKKKETQSSLATSSAAGTNSSSKMSSEDKRKHIKSLIDKIPTDKSALFEYTVDWDMVDNQLMEKRIRPWVNKKIAEYIGEPEPTLTDFICSKVLAGSTPKAVLEDVQMVLDEEAEVFVVKMWRLLIYEIESKKLKAASAGSA